MNEFYTAYPLIKQLYGVEISPTDFEEIGLIAWRHIGNKYTKLYQYTTPVTKDINNFYIELPCNCDILEAVTYGWEDWNYVTNKNVNGDYASQFTENYIESRKINKPSLYMSGRFARYEQVGDTLYFDKDYGTVHILYKGIVLDDESLPYISDKEALAIATYCSMTKMRRDGFEKRNNDIIQQSQLLYQEWLKLCNAARVPEYINQNEMDEILDVNSSWDRKRFGKSYKAIK